FWRAWLERFAPSRFPVVLPQAAPVTTAQQVRTAVPQEPQYSGRERTGGLQGTFTVSAYKVGQCELPGPIVFRGSPAGEWFLLYFYMIVIRCLGQIITVHTRIPRHL